MEFTISRKSFSSELSKITSVIGKKSNVAILECILIESDAQSLKLTATNLETTIVSKVSSDLLLVTEEGQMCVPAKRIIDIVKLCPDGPIKLTSDKTGWITVVASKSNWRIPGQLPDAFPAVPNSEGLSWVDVSAPLLKKMLPSVKYAITNEEARSNLRGAKLELIGSDVRVVATDGSRVSKATGKLSSLSLDDLEVTIPVESIDEILNLSEGAETVGIALAENALFFRMGSRVLASRLMSAKFPNYEMAFKTMGTYEDSGTFKASDLAQSVRCAMLCSSENENSEINMIFEPEQVRISAASADLGEADVTLGSNFTGRLKICCNGKFLNDFLDSAGSGIITLEIKDSVTQMFLSAEADGVQMSYALMPMRNSE